jgi:hypothetical protein
MVELKLEYRLNTSQNERKFQTLAKKKRCKILGGPSRQILIPTIVVKLQIDKIKTLPRGATWRGVLFQQDAAEDQI